MDDRWNVSASPKACYIKSGLFLQNLFKNCFVVSSQDRKLSSKFEIIVNQVAEENALLTKLCEVSCGHTRSLVLGLGHGNSYNDDVKNCSLLTIYLISFIGFTCLRTALFLDEVCFFCKAYVLFSCRLWTSSKSSPLHWWPFIGCGTSRRDSVRTKKALRWGIEPQNVQRLSEVLLGEVQWRGGGRYTVWL